MIKMSLSVYKLDSCLYEKPVCILQEGEHVIGRGELLECNDKRASRTHASINIINGNATITSTHQNPCFFQAVDSKTIVILTEGVPVNLNEGDKFGIFPDQYWFKIKFEGKDELINNKCKSASHKRILNEDTTTQNKIIKLQNNSECSGSNGVSTNPNHNTCRKVIREIETSIEKEFPHLDNDNNINTVESREEQPDIVLAHNEVVNSTDQLESLDLPSSNDDINIVITENTQPNEVMNSTDQLESRLDLPSTSDGTTNTAIIQNTKIKYIKDKLSRNKCWYGNNCYRKNSQHKKEFIHPGDSDYDSDPKNSQPVCGYGAKCYRKNKDHQKQYKHPPARKELLGKRQSNEDEDDYDYDDPFLDDDSADDYVEESWSECDTSEDSNGDEDDEDRKTLMKEAKRFTKKK